MIQAEETKGVPGGEGRVVGALLYSASVAVGGELHVPGASRAGKPVSTRGPSVGEATGEREMGQRKNSRKGKSE